VLWFSFTVGRYSTYSSCDGSPAACAADHALKRDPYCLFDPVCLSPFFVDGGVGSAPLRWQGTAYLGDPLLITYNPVELLSLPNYALFMSVYVGALLGIVRGVHAWRVRRTLIVAVATVAVLEAARWCFLIYSLSVMTQYTWFMNDPRTFLVLAALLAPMALATRAAWKYRAAA
jgi:hypothetical protein